MDHLLAENYPQFDYQLLDTGELQKLEEKFGERFHPAKILIDHQKASTTFYPGVQNG